MKKYCLALDLVEDDTLIKEYVDWHENVWEEIKASIKDAGVKELEIYLYGSRLFMIIIAEDSFSFEKKALMDGLNPKVQEWEQLMWKYQQALPGSQPGEKWVLLEKICSIN